MDQELNDARRVLRLDSAQNVRDLGGYGTEQTPGDLDTIADLQKLDGLLRDKGYSTEDVEGIFHNNWLRFFREVWS